MLNMGYPFKSLSKEGRRGRDKGVTIWVTNLLFLKIALKLIHLHDFLLSSFEAGRKESKNG